MEFLQSQLYISVGSFKSYVSFAQEPNKRDYILLIGRITPYIYMEKLKSQLYILVGSLRS